MAKANTREKIMIEFKWFVVFMTIALSVIFIYLTGKRDE